MGCGEWMIVVAHVWSISVSVNKKEAVYQNSFDIQQSSQKTGSFETKLRRFKSFM